MLTTQIDLPGTDCPKPLFVEQKHTTDYIHLNIRDDRGEIATVVVKWQNGALYLDGWTFEDVHDDAGAPTIERVLYDVGDEA